MLTALFLTLALASSGDLQTAADSHAAARSAGAPLKGIDVKPGRAQARTEGAPLKGVDVKLGKARAKAACKDANKPGSKCARAH